MRGSTRSESTDGIQASPPEHCVEHGLRRPPTESHQDESVLDTAESF